MGVTTNGTACTRSRRSTLPAIGRRRQANGHGALPTWTDHNVSDPGVTLIETFAYMTDVLLYRLNRVPDRLYLKFLELIGLQLFPATSARTGVTFYLSSPAQATLTLPRGTRVATLRTETEDPVVFTTVEDLPIVACSLGSVLSAPNAAESPRRSNRTIAPARSVRGVQQSTRAWRRADRRADRRRAALCRATAVPVHDRRRRSRS